MLPVGANSSDSTGLFNLGLSSVCSHLETKQEISIGQWATNPLTSGHTHTHTHIIIDDWSSMGKRRRKRGVTKAMIKRREETERTAFI